MRKLNKNYKLAGIISDQMQKNHTLCGVVQLDQQYYKYDVLIEELKG